MEALHSPQKIERLEDIGVKPMGIYQIMTGNPFEVNFNPVIYKGNLIGDDSVLNNLSRPVNLCLNSAEYLTSGKNGLFPKSLFESDDLETRKSANFRVAELVMQQWAFDPYKRVPKINFPPDVIADDGFIEELIKLYKAYGCERNFRDSYYLGDNETKPQHGIEITEEVVAPNIAKKCQRNLRKLLLNTNVEISFDDIGGKAKNPQEVSEELYMECIDNPILLEKLFDSSDGSQYKWDKSKIDFLRTGFNGVLKFDGSVLNLATHFDYLEGSHDLLYVLAQDLAIIIQQLNIERMGYRRKLDLNLVFEWVDTPTKLARLVRLQERLMAENMASKEKGGGIIKVPNIKILVQGNYLCGKKENVEEVPLERVVHMPLSWFDRRKTA